MRTALTNLVTRRRTLVLVLIAALAASTAAWAYWAAKSSGSASGHVGSLTAPSIGSAVPGGGTVTLSWTTVAAPGAGTVSYYVRRDGNAASSACPSAVTPSTATSCTDTGVSTGSHSYTVTAVWHSWTATSSPDAAQVLTGAATHLVLVPATTSPTAGAGDNLTITAKDASNNTVTSYSGAKSLTFSGAGTTGSYHPSVTASDGTATAFGASETINFNAGVASVSAQSNGTMKLYKAETASIKVTDGTLENGGGVAVTVAPAAAESYALATPSTQTAGTAFSEAITAKDAYGNTATSYSGKQAVVFSGPSSSPNGEAPKYPATVTFGAGSGTASITLYDAEEGTTLTATQGSLSGKSGGFTVNPLTTVTGFALSAPGAQTAGEAFAETITARDTYGNTVASYNSKQTISFSGPSSSPNGKSPTSSASVTFAGGSGTASLTLYDAQTTALTAVLGTIKGTSASFTVVAAAAGSLALPTPSSQTAGNAFNVTLTAKDAYGNTASSYQGTKPIGFSGPGESPGGEAPKYPSSVSFNAGVGTASITLYDAQTTALTARDEANGLAVTTGNLTVSARSATTQFGVSIPAGTTAGASFNATVIAEDEYGNTTTGYSSTKTMTFSGPAKSPSGKSPSYDTSVSFSAGKATATTTLYDAQSTTLKVTQGTVSGESDSFTVASGTPSSFNLSAPGTQTAGIAFTLTITGAKDSYGNVAAGTQTLGFSGPATAPDGTVPNYPTSAAFAGGEAKATVTLSDAQTTSLKVSTSAGSSTTSSFTVGPAAMAALSLSAATTTTAGAPDSLAITAVDGFENTVTSYSGPRSLEFEGATSAGAKHPTVSNSSEAAVPFGTPTTISFSAGVAKVSGSSNGVMKLYAVETAHVIVSDGTYSNGSGLAVTVEGASVSALSLLNGNGFSGRGKIEAGDSFKVEFGSPIAVASMCSTWSGNASDQSIAGNSEVTVTVTDGSGVSDDSVSVAASKCTFHLGTIDLGSNAYISAGNVTFGGSGANKSTVKYTAASAMLEIVLGTKGGSGTVKQVSSSAVKLTPDAGLTDEFGNAFPAFSTSTGQQF